MLLDAEMRKDREGRVFTFRSFEPFESIARKEVEEVCEGICNVSYEKDNVEKLARKIDSRSFYLAIPVCGALPSILGVAIIGV